MKNTEEPAPGEPRPAVIHIEADSLYEPETVPAIDPSPDCGVEISGGGAAGNAIQDIQHLLGEGVVLLPIRRGEKGPLLPGWQLTTIEAMHDASYREQLGRGNIGVLLGRASGGLCAIDIDTDAGVEPFLALNPQFRDTLASKGARGVQLWVKIAGEFPALTKIKTEAGADWGEWRADGGQSVIYGQHPSGMEYRRINNVPPITVAFDEINWPGDLKLPWLKDASDLLTEEHGPAYAVKPGLQTNDYFFAARYAAEHLVLWEPLEEEFYQYGHEKGLWAVTSTDAIKYQLGLDFKRVADETKLDEFLWKRTDGKLASLVNILRGMVEKKNAFEDRLSTIHFANGMLDLSSSPPMLMSFHPDYYSRNICPIALDPEAECPRFIEELLRSALDEDDIELLQKWCGGVLLGRNPAQRFLLLTGTPGGGKSTLIEIIEKVIGEQNVAQLRTKFLGKQFELYRYLGKTLLTGKDVNAEFLSEQDVDVLKALIGNDLLDAEKKHGNEQFQLRGIFNVAITCNSRLRLHLEGDGGAWRRRLLIVEYSKAKPEHRITEFGDKLIKEEGAGILNWMVEGAIRYLAEIEEFGDIQLTPAQKNRVEVLLQESDSVRQFVQQRVVAAEGSDTTVQEMLKGYTDFCEEMGWRAFPPREFQASLPDLMLEIHRVGKRHDLARGFEKARGFGNVRIEGGL
ncbi:MAG: phage/plasmid primase, P4 family [bacterium]